MSGSGSEVALDKLGPEKTIPWLIRAIAGQDQPRSRWQRFYGRHYSKIPALLRQRLPAPQPAQTADRTESIQRRAAYYLAYLADKHPSSAGIAVPQLVPLIEGSNRSTRFSAGIALSGFGSNAAPAVPVIEKLLKNNPEKMLSIMLNVLEKCGPEANGVIPTLKNCLDSTNGPLSILCARTLWRLDSSQADLVRPVAKRWSGAKNAAVRIESASLLWQIDSNPAPVVPVLVGLLNEDDNPFHYRTLLLLKQIGPGASNAIPALTKRLKRKPTKEAVFLKAADKTLQTTNRATPINSTTNTAHPAPIIGSGQ